MLPDLVVLSPNIQALLTIIRRLMTIDNRDRLFIMNCAIAEQLFVVLFDDTLYYRLMVIVGSIPSLVSTIIKVVGNVWYVLLHLKSLDTTRASQANRKPSSNESLNAIYKILPHSHYLS